MSIRKMVTDLEILIPELGEKDIYQRSTEVLAAQRGTRCHPHGLEHRLLSPLSIHPDRAVYAVKFEKAPYVLHAFQKKSPKGIKTAQTDVQLVSRRLKVASEDYEARYGKQKKWRSRRSKFR